MAYTKRCFSSVEALRRLDPQVLRELLALFPAYLTERRLALPDAATEENLDYPAIRDALMGERVPAELDDILYLASLLGNARSWGIVERQAEEDRRILPTYLPKHGYVDQAVLAATEDWPKHQDFLAKANARARVHSRSSYVYYAPAMDYRARYRNLTPEFMQEARDYLTEHFIQQGLIEENRRDRATEIIPYDFEKEIWFLIRYPGKQSRQSVFDGRGEWTNFVGNPEQYDAVAYNKVYGDLRMNTHRKTEHAKYRIAFGRMLFDEANVFRPTARIVTLDPLLAPRAEDLFNVGDIEGLKMIAPIEVSFECWGMPPKEYTVKALDGETLLAGNEESPRVLPERALSVRRVVLAYQLSNSTRTGKLTLQVGNRVNYERDGDSVVVENWLRRRGFVRSFVEVISDGFVDMDARRAIAVGA